MILLREEFVKAYGMMKSMNITKRITSTGLFMFVAMALCCLIASAASGETITWSGNGNPDNGGNWSDPANWNPRRVPVAGDDVILPPTAANRVVQIDTSSLGAITIDIQGGTLRGARYGTISGITGITVRDGATLAGDGMTLNNIPLTVSGAGVVVSENPIGALKFDGDQYSANGMVTGAVALASDTTMNVGPWYGTATNKIVATFVGTIDGAGGITKIGKGKLILNGTATYAGTTIVKDGILQVDKPLVNSPVVLEAGATLIGAPIMFPQGITNNGGTYDPGPNKWWGNGDSNNDGDWETADNWTWGEVPGESALAVLGSVTGNGSSGTNVRMVTINAEIALDELQMSQDTASYHNRLALAANLSVNKITPSGQVGNMQINLGWNTLTVNTGSLPALSGGGQLVKIGAANLAFTGGDFSGSIDVQEGTLNGPAWSTVSSPSSITVADGASFGVQGALTLNVPFTLNGAGATGGALVCSADGYSKTNRLNRTVTLVTDSVIYVGVIVNYGSGPVTTTIAGAVEGEGGLTKKGGGILILAGENTYSGITTVSAGTFQANSPLLNSAVELEAGATLIGPPIMYPMGVTNNGGTWDPGPNKWWGDGDPNNDGNWSLNANWLHNAPPGESETAILDSVTGNGSSGNNTRTVHLDTAATVATLTINQESSNFNNLLLLEADMTAGTFAGTGSNRSINLGGNTLTFSGGTPPPLAGTGTLAKTGPAASTYNGGSFSGTIEIQQGTLTGYYGAFNSAGMITVADGATLEFGRPTLTAPLTLNGAGGGGGDQIRASQ